MEDANGQVRTHKRLLKYIVSRGHEFFGMSYPRSNYWNKSEHIKRRLILAVLRNYTFATEEEICDLLVYSTKRAMWASYQKIKDDLSDDLYGSDRTKFIYNQLINYLKLNQNDTNAKGTQENGDQSFGMGFNPYGF